MIADGSSLASRVSPPGKPRIVAGPGKRCRHDLERQLQILVDRVQLLAEYILDALERGRVIGIKT